MKKIELDGIEIEVVKKRIKNINLTVYPLNGYVRISAPLKANEELIRSFAASKLSWIQKKLKKHEDKKQQLQKDDGNFIYIFGVQYLIKKIIDNSSYVVQNLDVIELHIKDNTSVQKEAQILKDWLKKMLKEASYPIIEKWEKILNLKVNTLKVREARSRWGSCNVTKKSISLNLELIKRPKVCLEYVIVHEMLHLIEPNHSKRFFDLMDRFMPDWREKRELLNG